MANRRQRAAEAARLDPMTRVWLLMGTIATALLLLVAAAYAATQVTGAAIGPSVLAVLGLGVALLGVLVAVRSALGVARHQVPSDDQRAGLWADVVLLVLFAAALTQVGLDVVLVPVLGALPLVLGLLRLRPERQVEG